MYLKSLIVLNKIFTLKQLINDHLKFTVMPRIPYAQEGEEAAEATPVYESLKEDMGMVPNLVKLLGHSGGATQMIGAVLGNYFNNLSIDPKIREIAYLTATKYNGCPYCLGHHTMFGKKAGLSQKQIDAINENGADGGDFTEAEQAVIRFAHETTKNVDASDKAIDELKKYFGTKEIAEIAASVASANFIQRIGKNFGAELEMENA